MTKAGDMLAGLDDVFVDWLEETLTVTNYNETGEPDAYGDYQNVSSSNTYSGSINVSTTGQHANGDQNGFRAEADVEIFIDDDARIVTASDENYSEPTHISDEGGHEYVTIGVIDEGNGRLHVWARANK